MISVSWELTDTFCGQANYAWVRRGITQVKNNASRLAIVRAVKLSFSINQNSNEHPTSFEHSTSF
jgi:hypothetical protein